MPATHVFEVDYRDLMCHGQSLVHRQSHYPPGPEEIILAGDGDDSQAPLCLGHCITDLKHSDYPINSNTVVAFPQRMSVFSSHVVEFKWERKGSFATSLALATSALSTFETCLVCNAPIETDSKKQSIIDKGYTCLADDFYNSKAQRRKTYDNWKMFCDHQVQSGQLLCSEISGRNEDAEVNVEVHH